MYILSVRLFPHKSSSCVYFANLEEGSPPSGFSQVSQNSFNQFTGPGSVLGPEMQQGTKQTVNPGSLGADLSMPWQLMVVLEALVRGNGPRRKGGKGDQGRDCCPECEKDPRPPPSRLACLPWIGSGTSRSRAAWLWVLILPPTSCETLGKSIQLNLTFLISKIVRIKHFYLQGQFAG